VDGVGALDLRVGVAGVEWRADAEAPLDPDDPRGLGGIALLVEDGPVDPRREPVDAAAIRALERNLEELVALGVLQTLDVCERMIGRRRMSARSRKMPTSAPTLSVLVDWL